MRSSARTASASGGVLTAGAPIAIPTTASMPTGHERGRSTAMLTDLESRLLGPMNNPPDDNPECEDCGRGLVTRFGGEVPPQFCPSCESDWDRLDRAGKIVVGTEEELAALDL